MSEALRRIAQRWDKVERRLKEAEHITTDVQIPAINELRYAGRRLVDALNETLAPDDDGQKDRRIGEHVSVAETYVRNADHDITDALVNFYDLRIREVLLKHGRANVLKHFEYIATMQDDIAACQDASSESRGDRAKRDEAYDRIYDKHVQPLNERYKTFARKEPDIIYDALLTEKKLRTSERVNWIFGIATVLALILGVVFWIWPYPEVKEYIKGLIEYLAPSR